MCLLCGASQRKVTSGGEVVARWDSAGEGSEAEVVVPYGAWFAREIGKRHAHHWWSVGCHLSSTPNSESTMCFQFGGVRPWFTTLSTMPDVAVAEHLLLRAACAGREERFELLEEIVISFRQEPSVWDLLRDPSVDPEARREAFDEWLEEHALWRLADERWADCAGALAGES